METLKIPAIPTTDVKFEKGILSFNILEGCAYSPDLNGFTGGDWVKAHIRTKDGQNVRIRLDAGELVIEIMDLSTAAKDLKTGYLVGAKWKKFARFEVHDNF